jgi:hypothetical protein
LAAVLAVQVLEVEAVLGLKAVKTRGKAFPVAQAQRAQTGDRELMAPM